MVDAQLSGVAVPAHDVSGRRVGGVAHRRRDAESAPGKRAQAEGVRCLHDRLERRHHRSHQHGCARCRIRSAHGGVRDRVVIVRSDQAHDPSRDARGRAGDERGLRGVHRLALRRAAANAGGAGQ